MANAERLAEKHAYPATTDWTRGDTYPVHVDFVETQIERAWRLLTSNPQQLAALIASSPTGGAEEHTISSAVTAHENRNLIVPDLGFVITTTLDRMAA